MYNTSMNDATTAHPRRLKPWNKKLRSEFEDVSPTDHNELQGPWDTAIHRLFQDSDGFQVVPHLHRMNSREPERAIFYLIKIRSLPVCVFGIRPSSDLQRPQARIVAYKQVEHRLRTLLADNHPTPTIYGVSVIGDRFLIMEMNTMTALVNPALNTQGDVPISDVAPSLWWDNQVLKRLGHRRLNNMVNDIKDMVEDYTPRVPDILASEPEDSESDMSSLSSTDD